MAKSVLFKVTGTVGALCAQCFVAGLAMAEGPAVSGVNGKVEVSGGASSQPAAGAFRIGGSVAAPLGDAFGIQGDLSIQSYGALTGAGAIHLFARDPDSYLLGVTGGFVRSNNATLTAVGPEAELYLDRFSIEAWAGVANIDYAAVSAVDKSGVFALADLAYYATDDLRLSIGGSSVLGYEALSLGAEYQVTSFETPFSVTADARFGEDGAISAMAGLKFYFGDPEKSLIDRHREDDPKDRGLDLFAAAGSQVTETGIPKPKASDFGDSASCVAAGFTWISSSPEHCA